MMRVGLAAILSGPCLLWVKIAYERRGAKDRGRG
jgi:hypothetical protein